MKRLTTLAVTFCLQAAWAMPSTGTFMHNACKGKKAGDACSASGHSGACAGSDSSLTCVEGAKPGAPAPAPSATATTPSAPVVKNPCDGKGTGSACTIDGVAGACFPPSGGSGNARGTVCQKGVKPMAQSGQTPPVPK